MSEGEIKIIVERVEEAYQMASQYDSSSTIAVSDELNGLARALGFNLSTRGATLKITYEGEK